MVAEVLQLAQLVELRPYGRDGGRAASDRSPSLIRSGLPRFSFCDELGLDQELVGAALEDGEMMFEVEGHGP